MSEAEVIAAAENWFSGFQKLEQRAKKCIGLRGEYVEKIPSLVAVAFFLPGRAKDLSAPPYVYMNVSVCMYICVYMYIGKCIFLYVHVCIYVCMCAEAIARPQILLWITYRVLCSNQARLNKRMGSAEEEELWRGV